MSIPESNNLFHGSNSRQILNYFLSQLQAGDLSSEEALAMLSAVHADLGKGSLADPTVYQSYSSAMKSLQQLMPKVYDYVVSTWGREKKAESLDWEIQDTGFDEVDKDELKPNIFDADNKGKGFNGIKVSGDEFEKTEESPEAEELEEKETNPVDEGEEKVVEPRQVATEEETEEEEVLQGENQAEEIQESIEGNKNESVEEVENDEPKVEEKDLSEEEQGLDENESESSEESAAEGIRDESVVESDKPGAEGEAGVEPEEKEWPEIEQPAPEATRDGFQGEENSALPED